MNFQHLSIRGPASRKGSSICPQTTLRNTIGRADTKNICLMTDEIMSPEDVCFPSAFRKLGIERYSKGYGYNGQLDRKAGDGRHYHTNTSPEPYIL
jgi:hypothetical protein